MKTKKAISLIVLVVTIIVMIILAGAIIITLGNTGIIGKAQEAVDKTNMAQLKEEAEMIKWDLKLANSKLTQAELVTKLNEHFEQSTVAGNVITTGNGKYDITVGEDLTITVGKHVDTPIYFGDLYVADVEMDFDGAALTQIGFVLYENGVLENYIKVDEFGDMLWCMAAMEGFVIEDNNIIGNESEEKITIGTIVDKNTISMITDEEGTVVTLSHSNQEVHGIYRGYKYKGDIEEEGVTVQVAITLGINNILTLYENAEVAAQATVSLNYGDHYITDLDGNMTGIFVSVDGKTIMFEGISLTLDETTAPEDDLDLSTAIITPVEGSSEENIRAGNPMTGDTVEYNGYIYKYNMVYFLNQWIDAGSADLSSIGLDSVEWGVIVKNNALTTYPNMESVLFSKPVNALVYTYKDCDKLVEAPKISENAKSMFATFSNCASLTTAPVIPNNVTAMASAFSGCTSLTTAPTIPENVIDMEDTFSGCSKLTTAPTIPQNVTTLKHTFLDCIALTEAPIIPQNVTTMYSTFNGCSKLTTAPTIPDSVTNMSYTFSGCSSLTEAPVIPESVTNVSGIFYECSKLTGTVYINASNISVEGRMRDALSNCGTEGIGLTVVVPNDTLRELMANYSGYDSTKVTIVKEVEG